MELIRSQANKTFFPLNIFKNRYFFLIYGFPGLLLYTDLFQHSLCYNVSTSPWKFSRMASSLSSSSPVADIPGSLPCLVPIAALALTLCPLHPPPTFPHPVPLVLLDIIKIAVHNCTVHLAGISTQTTT